MREMMKTAGIFLLGVLYGISWVLFLKFHTIPIILYQVLAAIFASIIFFGSVLIIIYMITFFQECWNN